MDTKQYTILLVEDDVTLSEMYTMKLTSTGFDVWNASNGREGLQVLEKRGVPSLALLDVMMPVMDGFTMLEQMKSNDDWKLIPVVMLTNLGQVQDVERGKKLGAVDYLVKADLTPAQVVEKVRIILR